MGPANTPLLLPTTKHHFQAGNPIQISKPNSNIKTQFKFQNPIQSRTNPGNIDIVLGAMGSTFSCHHSWVLKGLRSTSAFISALHLAGCTHQT